MYDSVNPSAIPPAAQVVAGYVNGPVSQWPASGWDRFPHAVRIRIDVGRPPAPLTADVADVEDSDYTPRTFVDEFVVPRHARDWWSAGYASVELLAGNLDLFAQAPQTVYWVADWNLSEAQAIQVLAGRAPTNVPTTAAWQQVIARLDGRIVAVQWASPSSNGLPGYDESVVSDAWFPPPAPPAWPARALGLAGQAQATVGQLSALLRLHQ